MANPKDIIPMLEKLAAYYEKEPNDVQVQAYISYFSSFDESHFNNIFQNIVEEFKWMPTIAELRSFDINKVLNTHGDRMSHMEMVWQGNKMVALFYQGKISETELKTNKSYKYLMRKQAHASNCQCAVCTGEMTPDEITELTNKEVEQWMWEDHPEYMREKNG